MKIIVFGATGNVGRRVVAEALSRGHEVTAVARHRERLATLPGAVERRQGNVASADDVALLSAGHDLAVNAARPPTGQEFAMGDMTRALLDGIARSGARLLVVGGAATLIVPGGNGAIVLDDIRYLPAAARHIGEASRAQYEAVIEEVRVDWSYLSPPASLQPGTRTGRYRLGRDELLLDATGHSALSMEDLAVVLLDEAEQPRHHRVRFTAAY